jgi:branched-chain amino acid transport system substrate-binding protein
VKINHRGTEAQRRNSKNIVNLILCLRAFVVNGFGGLRGGREKAMRNYLLLVAAFFAITQGVAQETIKVGAITTLTGRLAEFGKQQQAGFQVAIDEINAAGGINGQQVELLLEDSASDVNKGLAAAEKLVNEGIGVVINEYSSSIVKAQAEYFTREQVPNIVVGSSDETITAPGSEYVFRVNATTRGYAETMMAMFTANDVKTITLLAGTGAFEKSLQESVIAQAEENGIEVLDSQAYDKGLTDFRPILNGFKGRNPDAIVLAGYQEDSVAVMRQSQEIGLSPKLFVGGATGFVLPAFIEGAGPASEFVATVAAWSPDVPGNEDLTARLSEALGGERSSHHAALAYGGMRVALDAVARAGSATDREAIRAALLETNLDVGYDTITFESFDGYQNQNQIPVIALQVQNVEGQLSFVPIYPTDTFDGQLIFPTPVWEERSQ